MLWKMAAVVAMEPEDHYIAELVGGLQAIDSGVTSILDYAHGQDTEAKAMAAARGLKDSGIAGWFAYQLGISYAFEPGDTVSGAEAVQAMFAIRSSEPEWNTAALLRKELFHDSSAPLRLALGPAMWAGNPIAEFRDEWARVRSTGAGLLVAHLHKPFRPFPAGIMGHRDSGIPDLHEAGLLGPDYHVAHANRLTSEELAMLRDTGGMIAATTMGEFPYMTQAHRGPSVHGRARAAGVPVGIGTDVPLALPDDFFEHVRSSLWSHYLEEESRQIVRDYRSRDTLDFATALGAKAIRLGDETGSITVGKRADLVLLNTGRIGFGAMGGLADRGCDVRARIGHRQRLDRGAGPQAPRRNDRRRLGVAEGALARSAGTGRAKGRDRELDLTRIVRRRRICASLLAGAFARSRAVVVAQQVGDHVFQVLLADLGQAEIRHAEPATPHQFRDERGGHVRPVLQFRGERAPVQEFQRGRAAAGGMVVLAVADDAPDVVDGLAPREWRVAGGVLSHRRRGRRKQDGQERQETCRSHA